jgi:hypothetical protein
MRSEINPSNNYRRDIIALLCNLSTFFNNTKPFKEITREDLLSFPDSYRKPESWIIQMFLLRISKESVNY